MKRNTFLFPRPPPSTFKTMRWKRVLTRKDLEVYTVAVAAWPKCGTARPLTLVMIRRLSEGLKLPADVLIADSESAPRRMILPKHKMS